MTAAPDRSGVSGVLFDGEEVSGNTPWLQPAGRIRFPASDLSIK